MDVHSLITLLGQRAGIPLVLSEAGTLALQFDGPVTLNIEYSQSEDVLHLYAIVGSDPYDGESRLSMYATLLEANVFGHETGGGALGLDTITGEVMLTRRVEVAIADVEQLSSAIEHMVSAAMKWTEDLASPIVRDSDAPLLSKPSDDHAGLVGRV